MKLIGNIICLQSYCAVHRMEEIRVREGNGKSGLFVDQIDQLRVSLDFVLPLDPADGPNP